MVEDGVIREFNFPDQRELMAFVADFLRETGNPTCAEEFFSLFPEDPIPPPTADLNLMLDNLNEWAAWYETNT